MRKKYGIEIQGVWDFFTIYFENGEQVSGPKEYNVPGGVNHAPTPEQLLADGRRLLIDPSHDTATHKLVDDSHSIVDAVTMQQDTESRSDQEIKDIKLAAIKVIADAKIEALVPNGEKNRWETKGIRLLFKRQKHMKDPGPNPDWTPEEVTLAGDLDTLGETTEQVREARDAIRVNINAASGQPLKDIDATETNPLWPS